MFKIGLNDEVFEPMLDWLRFIWFDGDLKNMNRMSKEEAFNHE